MAYFDPRHGQALALSPLLKELMDSAPQDGFLTDNQNRLGEMQVIHSLLALHADFSFQAPPTFRSRWSVFLSSLCLRKVHKFLPFGGSEASFFLPPLDLVHLMPWMFRPHSSKSPWPHLGVCSKSHLHTWFPAVASLLETYHHRNDSLASMYQNHSVDMH